MTSEDFSRAVREENRLTKLEEGQVALQSQVANVLIQLGQRLDGISFRMEVQGEAVRKHMDSDTAWMNKHTEGHARTEGFRAGEMAILAGIVTLGSAVSGLVIKLLP